MRWVERFLESFIDHELEQVSHAIGVAPLVVVPADELEEVFVQLHAGALIVDARVGAVNEVRAHDGILGVSQYAFEVGLARVFHVRRDFRVAGALLGLEREIHHRRGGGRHAEGHAGEFALHLRAHEAHRLGCAGAGGDDVGGRGAAVTPSFAARAVHRLLGGGVGVDGGHQTLSNSEAFLEQHVHDRGQAVCGAGGVGHDVMIRAVVEMVVHAHHHGEILVLGRGGNNHLLRAGFDVALGLFAIGEEAGGFDHHVHAEFFPRQLRRGRGFDHLDLGTIHHEGFIVLMADFTIERALSGIVFEQVGEVIGR